MLTGGASVAEREGEGPACQPEKEGGQREWDWAARLLGLGGVLGHAQGGRAGRGEGRWASAWFPGRRFIVFFLTFFFPFYFLKLSFEEDF